jgi:hypothetical protein
MFNIEKLKFGDVVYVVVTRNNMVSRTRLTFVDSAGETWHRYNLPPKTYTVEERTYCGKSTPVNEGVTSRNVYDDYITYYFTETDGVVGEHTFMGDNSHGEAWFVTLDDANAHIFLESSKFK